MKRRSICVGAATLVCLGAAIATPVAAQQKTLQDQLAGTWTLQSDTHEVNGKKTETFGPNPQGYFIFTPDGHFSIIITRRDIPKFASTRNNGTADENRSVVQGSISYFGTYAVDADNSVSLHVVASTFPNWNGANQKRTAEITGDQLKWSVPAASVGGSTVAILQRATPATTTGQGTAMQRSKK